MVDPSNLAQNTLTAVRSLQQINNQVLQLQHEAQMLLNQSRNLQNLPTSIVNQLHATLASSSQLITQAQGLTYQTQLANQQFSAQYPPSYSPGVSAAQMSADQSTRWTNTLHGLQTAIVLQAQVNTNLANDQGVLEGLVATSQSSAGALQAMQATNQLLALQAKQSIQLQQLALTQDRSASLELARQTAAVARGLEVTRRFLGSGTPYTTQAVSFYGN